MEDRESDVGMDNVAAAIFSLDSGNKENYLNCFVFCRLLVSCSVSCCLFDSRSSFGGLENPF